MPRKRREPMPIADRMAEVEKAAERLRAAEDDLDEARQAFRSALREAHRAGASYAMLGRAVGLSRQRVAELVSEG